VSAIRSLKPVAKKPSNKHHLEDHETAMVYNKKKAVKPGALSPDMGFAKTLRDNPWIKIRKRK
jgi:hypothetical protein